MPLRTLGDLALDGTALHRPKPLLLLAYLAFEGATPRRRLAELFFGDAKDPADSLSTALKYLKQHPAAALDLRSKTVATEVECDARLLVNDLESNDLTAAINRYQGPFLSTFELSLGEELEEWVYGTREFLARGVRGALLRLAEEEAMQGRLERASSQAERAYTLAGAPELEPEEIELLYPLLAKGGSPRAAALKREAAEVGVTLEPVERSRERPPHATPTTVQAHNLPERSTAFVGRDLELVEVATLLEQDECRLLTLTGPGGIGKTRLVLQAGWEAVQNSSRWDGVYFVPLEAVTSIDRILEALARVFNLQRRAATASAIVETIGNRTILLILDNFEHLLEGASLLPELLRHCPKLKVLVTSRERLNLEEEWVLPVAGLPVPDTTPDDAPRQDAVQLFLQRAKRASLHFSLTRDNAPHVLEICRTVGGSPLGIELAAAWVRMFPPEDIAREVAQDLDFLSTSSQSLAERHRSVRAAFEHSWRLLKPREQVVLSGLSVFQGGFRRDAASEVLGATLAVLASLVDKSLLRAIPGGRYDRHPLIYGYAQEKLEATERERLQRLHAGYYVGLAEEHARKLRGSSDLRELEVFEQEHENLRAAWRWSLDHEGTLALRLGGALGRFWEIRGHLSEGRRGLEEALTRYPDAPTTARARALNVLGRLTQLQGELSKAVTLFEKGLELWRLTDDKEGLAVSLNGLGTAALAKKDYTRAEPCFLESLGLLEAVGDKGAMAVVLNNLGEMARYRDDFRKASEYYEASLALQGEIGNTRRRALVLGNLGFVAWRLGDNKRAAAFQKESLALKYEVRDEIGLSYCFVGLAAVCCDSGEHERAASLLGVVDALIARTKHQLDPVDRNDAERTAALIRTHLDPVAFTAARDRGRAMSLDEAVEYALGVVPEKLAPSTDNNSIL
jgi:predicted ATPase